MKTKFTIGRDQSADIPIADASVSRHHAEITLLAGGKVFLTDCRSSNGTFVVRGGTERRITQETLTASDTAKFGDVSIRVSELLAAMGQASGGGGGGGAAPGPQNPSAKLVRCDCGAIKREDSPCPSCSQ